MQKKAETLLHEKLEIVLRAFDLAGQAASRQAQAKQNSPLGNANRLISQQSPSNAGRPVLNAIHAKSVTVHFV